jgi:hypothetical protein
VYKCHGVVCSLSESSNLIGFFLLVADPQVTAGTDSLDLWDVLSGRNGTSPRTTFVYNIEPDGKSTSIIKTGAVRCGRYKLLVNAKGGTCDQCPAGALGCVAPSMLPCSTDKKDDVPILIDLEGDPGENYNLYGVDGYEGIVAECTDLLEAYAYVMAPALFNVCDDEGAADPANFGGSWTTGWCEPPYAANAACGL